METFQIGLQSIFFFFKKTEILIMLFFIYEKFTQNI